MSLILSIETATSVCSVALHSYGELIQLEEINQANSHGRLIMEMIDKVVLNSGYKREDLQAVAVSNGPGSYTGLRIGVSTAKGIAFGLGVPLISIDTLQALAKQISSECQIGDLIIPMIDARRMEVYTSVFDHELNVIHPLSPVVVNDNVFLNYLEKGKVVFLGDGVDKVKKILEHSNAVFLDFQNSASTIGELANEKFVKKQFEDLAYFEPNYLKEFQVIKSMKNPLLQ